jgi:hypothetical protein
MPLDLARHHKVLYLSFKKPVTTVEKPVQYQHFNYNKTDKTVEPRSLILPITNSAIANLIIPFTCPKLH